MQDEEYALYEPLNEREQEILTLLAQNLTDQEIGQRLFLSINTVKWHNRHIFQKIGVKNRKQAVKRAESLNLFGEETTPAVHHTLPAQLTPFVGRVRELEDVVNLLSGVQPRLLTLLAPGGMGKTRLALAAAEAMLQHFPDGVYFVPLAALTSPDYIVSTMTDAVECPAFADGRSPKQRLADFLRRKQLLLVLDNCEHLLDGMPLVAELLHIAPQVKILATSRERLNLSGESLYALGGLRYPDLDSAESAGEYGAVRLFVDSAQRVNPQFAASDAEVVEICRLVQGMPLALELAAAWASTLTAAEIGDGIVSSADFLQAFARDVPDRLRSVRAVFETSWNRLGDREQRAFAAMSVFRGGCTREAALAVAGATNVILLGLSDKALLRRDPQTGRYDVHELLRQYAEEELAKAGEPEAVHQAHQDYYAALADEWAHAMQRGKQLESFAILGANIDNIRRALARAISRGVPEEIGHFTELIWYYDTRGWATEYVTAMRAAANILEPHDGVALAECLMYLSVFDTARLHLDRETAHDDATRALDMLRRLDAREFLPGALMTYVDSLESADNAEKIERLVREAFAIGEEFDDPSVMAALWHDYGHLAARQQNLPEATARTLEAHRRYSEAGNYWGMCHTIGRLGYLAFDQRDLAAAERYFRELLTHARTIGFDAGYAWGLDGLINLTMVQRDWPTLRRLSSEVLQIRRRIGLPDHQLVPTVVLEAEVAVALQELDEARRNLREALSLMNEQAREHFFDWWMVVAAGYLCLRGVARQAAAFLGFLDARGGRDAFDFSQATYDTSLSSCRVALTAEEFEAAIERGKRLTPDAAVAEILPFL